MAGVPEVRYKADITADSLNVSAQETSCRFDEAGKEGLHRRDEKEVDIREGNERHPPYKDSGWYAFVRLSRDASRRDPMPFLADWLIEVKSSNGICQSFSYDSSHSPAKVRHLFRLAFKSNPACACSTARGCSPRRRRE